MAKFFNFNIDTRDIRDRGHGQELVEEYGVDGIMIGRGVFQNPFAFTENEPPLTSKPLRYPQQRGDTDNQLEPSVVETGEVASADKEAKKNKLLDLLHYHLDLFDQHQEQTKRPYETLKRFYKIYIRDFDGASEVRDKLMHTKSTDEAREIINKI